MCAAQQGIINILRHGNSVADKIDITSFSFSFISICLNPILLLYIFDINLGTQFLSIMIMLQMTCEWFAAIASVLYIFCPIVKTDQMWFNLIFCHMWSSTFIYNLFIMFCKFNAMSMLIERCFRLFYPNKNIFDYPRTIFTSYCFAMIYITAINLRFTAMVQMDSDGECVAVGKSPIDEFHQQQLLVFGYLCLALLLILPAIVVTTCYLLMIIHYIRRKRSNKNFNGFNLHNLQDILTVLVIIWSAESTIANILDMVSFYDFKNYGYTKLAEIIQSSTELVRIIFFVSRTLSLFICIQSIRSKFIEHIQFIGTFFIKIFKRLIKKQ
ncbi:unnamed protein product [Schistosoma margrebowiei]|uniref:G_PROTEIN_RECEP_F1_2 domain-containing protein n=1 Tax=Schistosoma margrebowiei TaxID=48269 RepID=A0A183MYS8_9TREM|nr:unnamed protein product [Schistosoma margrebowiei]VDP38646.1 unnamed protein product [Schistosoma margrebowiei]